MKIILLSLFGFLLALPSSLAMPVVDLGYCDPSLSAQDEFYNYMCKRNDGSRGWLNIGGKIGFGSPIFAIANRDTDRAFLVLKDSLAYPGFYCYYKDQSRLNNPSSACIRQVRERVARPAKNVFANCSQLSVKTTTGDVYKFWELDGQRYMHWLGAASKPIYVNGEPLRMAGGMDSIITTAFATLCPAQFRAFGAKTGN